MKEGVLIIDAFSGINRSFGDNDAFGKRSLTKKKSIYANDGNNFEIINDKLKTGRIFKEISFTNDILSKSITGLFELKMNALLFELIGEGVNLYRNRNNTLVVLNSDLNDSGLLDFVEYNETLIMCNGVSKPIYFDGTDCDEITFTDPNEIFLGIIPKGSFIHANRLYYFNDTTIFAPKVGTYDDFTNDTNTVDAIKISSGKGDDIQAVASIGDTVIIFKTRSIYRLTGSQPFSETANDPHRVETINSNVGCISKRSIVQAGNDIYFLTNYGLQSISGVMAYGDFEISNLFVGINEEFDRIIKVGKGWNSFGVYDEANNYILEFIPYDENETYMFGYNIVTKDITKRVFTKKLTAANFIPGKGLYIGDSKGNVYKSEVLY